MQSATIFYSSVCSNVGTIYAHVGNYDQLVQPTAEVWVLVQSENMDVVAHHLQMLRCPTKRKLPHFILTEMKLISNITTCSLLDAHEKLMTSTRQTLFCYQFIYRNLWSHERIQDCFQKYTNSNN